FSRDWSSDVCSSDLGHDEDARADDGTDAQQHQVAGGQGPLERRFALQGSFDRFAGIDMRRRFDRLDPEQTLRHWRFPDSSKDGCRREAQGRKVTFATIPGACASHNSARDGGEWQTGAAKWRRECAGTECRDWRRRARRWEAATPDRRGWAPNSHGRVAKRTTRAPAEGLAATSPRRT